LKSQRPNARSGIPTERFVCSGRSLRFGDFLEDRLLHGQIMHERLGRPHRQGSDIPRVDHHAGVGVGVDGRQAAIRMAMAATREQLGAMTPTITVATTTAHQRPRHQQQFLLAGIKRTVTFKDSRRFA
jgi:hypothetical protein